MSGSGKGFWLNESGATAALYALALPALVAVAGVGFDYARLAGLDSELQNAADQAALAGVTQLDGKTNACSRAAAAASGLVNRTLLANDGAGLTIAVGNESGCDTAGVIRFWQDAAATTAATTDAEARFVEIVLGTRRANYALTPIVGAFGGDIVAAAVAGMGGAICGTAALFYCNPTLPANFNPDAYKGYGILVGTMSGSGSWGYLQVPPSNNANGVEEVLAQDQPAVECRSTATTPTALTGSATGLVRAINTRFDIFDNNIVNNNQPCENLSDCSPAANVIKDVVRNNSNKWVLPTDQFVPAYSATYSPAASYDADGLIGSMGLPRDLCHYAAWDGHGCGSGLGSGALDIGNGQWARAEYFNKYHLNHTPTNYTSMTRYETYKWEQANGRLADNNNVSAAPGTQYSMPVTTGASTSSFDRRVLTIALTRGSGGSCPGASNPAVVVHDWIDVFFVQPGVSGRGNYPAGVNPNSSDPIYMEIIGRSSNGSTGAQLTRRDVPYLVR
jgi:Flp pilus assembly protein TadG